MTVPTPDEENILLRVLPHDIPFVRPTLEFGALADGVKRQAFVPADYVVRSNFHYPSWVGREVFSEPFPKSPVSHVTQPGTRLSFVNGSWQSSLEVGDGPYLGLGEPADRKHHTIETAH